MLLNTISRWNLTTDRKARSVKTLLQILSVSLLGMAACSAPTPAEKVVNVYTARHYDSDLALYDQFTRETGIKVNRIEGKADELVARLKAEGANSPADVFIAADAGALWRAQEAGLFQALKSQTLEGRIPAALREPEGAWFGFSRRARVVAYDAAKVKPEEVDDYAELAGPRFRGKICVRSSDSIYNLSLVGALIEAWGPQKAEAWAKGVVANMARPPEGGDRDQIRAVASGVCEVAITNSYYYLRMASGTDAADRAVTEKVKLAFPSLDGQGTHVNIAGLGLAKASPNRENAVRLMEFLTSPAAQAHIAANNSEFPVSPEVEAPETVRAYAGFKAHPMSASAFARRQPEAQSIMSAAGWR
jgi:iron(III) transport system substrate-binding protein